MDVGCSLKSRRIALYRLEPPWDPLDAATSLAMSFGARQKSPRLTLAPA
jgi:hypothetical protein